MLSERVLEWTEQWKQEGLEEGRQEGERRVLQRQLARRFGDLPEWATSRLAQADLEALEGWAERVLDAGTLEEVFQ